MTTQIERLGGFADIDGRRFNTVVVTGFAGRNPVRWNVKCEKCGSAWIEHHIRLTGAGDVFRCKNDACAKGLIEPRKTPQSVEPDPPPTPEPAVKLSPDYTIYTEFMAEQGLPMATYEEWKRLDTTYQARLLAPALQARQAQEKQRELQAIGEALSQASLDEIRRKYGIR